MRWIVAIVSLCAYSAVAQMPPVPQATATPKRFKTVSVVKGATMLISAPATVSQPTTNALKLSWCPAPGCFTRILQTTDLRTWTEFAVVPITQTELTVLATNDMAAFKTESYIACVDGGYWVCPAAVTKTPTTMP